MIGGRLYVVSFVFASSSLPNAIADFGSNKAAAISAPVRLNAVWSPVIRKALLTN